MNCAELRDAHGDIDNHHSQVGFGNEAYAEYKDNWDQTSDVLYKGEAMDSPIGLEWGEI